MARRSRPQAGYGSERVWVAAVCAAGTGLLLAESRRFDWKLDDAYITFTYAQNWVAGHGLVFNVGERVEGYTCFLWVVLSALGLRLGADIGWWSTLLGIASAIGAVMAAWRLAWELVPPRLRPAAVVTTLVVGGYPALAWWAVSGMETTLFTMLVTVAVWRHVRDGAGSCAAPVCLALASMTRPEGWLLAGILCLDALRCGPRRQAYRYVGIFMALFGPYYAWRCWYYGYPLPNTFYAKVGETVAQVQRGLVYVFGFLTAGVGAFLLLGAMGTLFTAVARRLVPVYLFCVAYFAYVIVVGGDVFFFYRFFIPVVPLLGAVSVAAILRLLDRVSPRGGVAVHAASSACAVAFLAMCGPLYRAQSVDVWDARFGDAVGRAVCACLRQRTAPGDAVAAVSVGRIGFCGGQRVIDMVGLTDKHIAHQAVTTMGQGFAGHEKFDSAYILAQWPAYILIPALGHTPKVEAVDDMWQQAAFRQHYVLDKCGYRRVWGKQTPEAG